MTVKIKICGITRLEDALFAAEAGADALGFIFYKKSPRYITPEAAGKIIAGLPPFTETVGVFVNEPMDTIPEIKAETGFGTAQLHGDETPEECDALPGKRIKAFRVKPGFDPAVLQTYRVNAYLLDTYSKDAYGGTGKTFDWETALQAKERGRIILAGGLTPENAAEAVRRVRPYAVDVSGGVEVSPGIKDHEKITAFIQEVRKAETAT